MTNSELILQISDLLSQLKNRAQLIEKTYKLTEVEFSKGDIVYYVNPQGDIVPAIIDDIRQGNQSGDFVFYSIHEEGAKISWWNKFKFFLLIKIPWLHFRYDVPQGYPGHGVLAGDDIFRTEQEAEIILMLYNSIYNLVDYQTFLMHEERAHQHE